ncbi:unnamed protein product [Danaus chrysippus]|uniref:(African queen) hypothetical protein n=1 Tax=Danaus chrysippus TaxID=151541 RepID=A0A8J2MHK7_9NEOP|nr:unnamed protein product [Danaus chrysippus]
MHSNGGKVASHWSANKTKPGSVRECSGVPAAAGCVLRCATHCILSIRYRHFARHSPRRVPRRWRRGADYSHDAGFMR